MKPFNPGQLAWDSVKAPSSSGAKSYGGYAGGCIDGAVPIPLDSNHYIVGRPDRGRIFAHPAMISLIQRVSTALNQEGVGRIVLSDLGQARGGPPPASSSHLSHQTGLDVDIWYVMGKSSEVNTLFGKSHSALTVRPHAKSVVLKSGKGVNRRIWKEDFARMLKRFSEASEVDRIFVNARIKEELCRRHQNQGWLNKIRPWWGHSSHFHVRMKCPADSPDCESQPLPLKGDGCDETLEWWFSDEAKITTSKAPQEREFILPDSCKVVFER